MCGGIPPAPPGRANGGRRQGCHRYDRSGKPREENAPAQAPPIRRSVLGSVNCQVPRAHSRGKGATRGASARKLRSGWQRSLGRISPRAPKRAGLARRKPQGADAPGGGRKANGCAAVLHGPFNKDSAVRRQVVRSQGCRHRFHETTEGVLGRTSAHFYRFARRRPCSGRSIRSGGEIPPWRQRPRRLEPVGGACATTEDVRDRATLVRLLQSPQGDAGGRHPRRRTGQPGRRRKRSSGEPRGVSGDGMRQVGLVEAGGRRTAPSTVPAPRSANSLGPNWAAPLRGDDA